MPASVTYNMIGHSGERSRVTLGLPVLTGANYDDVTGNGATDSVGALRIAIGAISLMNFESAAVGAITHPDAGGLPTDPNAQRERGLRVFYTDDVTSKKYHFTIPGPDMTLVAQAGTDVVDHTSNVAAVALVAVLEAEMRSPDGNAITVTGMRTVGRAN